MTDSTFYCSTLSGAYETELCYTFLEGGCSISISGTTCNSCETVSCGFPTPYLSGKDPFAWDCTNVPGGTQGSYCNQGDIPIPEVRVAILCFLGNDTAIPDDTSGVPSAASAGVPSAPSGGMPSAASEVPSAETTRSNAPSNAPVEAEEEDSDAPTAPPMTAGPTMPEPSVITNAPVGAVVMPEPHVITNAPVGAVAAPPSTSGGSVHYYDYDYYGTVSSVWVVVWTSLVTGMAIALGAAGGS